MFNAELAEVLGKDRFLREIELTAGLTHPHILPLYDSGLTVGPPWPRRGKARRRRGGRSRRAAIVRAEAEQCRHP